MSLRGKSRTLVTPRLLLRPLQTNDAQQMQSIYSDPEVMKYWSCEPMTDLDAVREFTQKDIDSDASGDSLNFAITLQDSGEVIGKCILFKYDPANRRAEVGYILKRSHWRTGMMSEAISALIDFAFSSLELHRLEADTDPDNKGSLALLQKLGFQHEGLFRDRWYVYGEWQDSVMLGLLESDWNPE